MRNCSKKIVFLILILLLLAVCFIVTQTASYSIMRSKSNEVLTVNQVEYETDTGISGKLKLPASLEKLPPQSVVTLTANIDEPAGKELLLGSISAPMKVYFDGNLALEYGQKGSYPDFFNDPPIALITLELPLQNEEIVLKITYRFPNQRNTLELPVIRVGTNQALLTRQFHQDGFFFVFSITLIFLGSITVASSLIFMRTIRSSFSFMFLGLFSFLTGIWSFGECDLTVLLIPYPALLHAMVFLGVFLAPIPFLHFGLLVLNPKDRRPVKCALWCNFFTVVAALILQLSGRMDFYKSLNYLHLIIILSFIAFMFSLFKEWVKYKNPAARRFGPGIVILAVSVLFELLNYWFHLTGAFSFFFLIGFFGFILSLGIVSGHYVRESLHIAAEKKQLEYKMEAVNHQLALQRLEFQRIAENDALIKAQRHDLRHQLTVLKVFYDRNDREKLGNYLKVLNAKLPAEREAPLCENYAVNAVASYYADMAKRAGADNSVSLSVPLFLPPEFESDLCVIIGNLMENAAEACARMNGEDRFIRVNSHLKYRILTITVDNSFEGTLRQKGGVFLSSKRNGEGIGLSSVSAVAKKYGGNAKFEERDGVFQSSVYLYIREEEK